MNILQIFNKRRGNKSRHAQRALRLESLERREMMTSYMLCDHWGGAVCDADKLPGDDGPGETTGDPNFDDDLMCWAAAASNVLEWSGWGKVDGMYNTDRIFDYFQDHWDDVGVGAECAWRWWFDGEQPDWPVEGGGGFWLTEDLEDYFHDHRDYDDPTLMHTVDRFLRAGYGTTLGIALGEGEGRGEHLITCWGYEHGAEPNDYLGIHVTDSDDNLDSRTPRGLDVAYDDTNDRWYLRDYPEHGDNGWYLVEVLGLEQIPPERRPDLRCSDIPWEVGGMRPDEVAVGDSWRCNFLIHNDGQTDSGSFRVEFYASTDSTIDPADDPLLGWARVDNLRPRSDTWVHGPGYFPETADGVYHVGIVIDTENEVRERSETNNTATIADRLLTAASPDLVGTSFYVTDSSGGPHLLWGEDIRISGYVSNRGGKDANGSVVQFYLSGNNFIYWDDTRLGEVPIGPVESGSSARFDVTLTLPDRKPHQLSASGRAWIGMTIDPRGRVAESNESNNSNQGDGRDKDSVVIFAWPSYVLQDTSKRWYDERDRGRISIPTTPSTVPEPPLPPGGHRGCYRHFRADPRDGGGQPFHTPPRSARNAGSHTNVSRFDIAPGSKSIAQTDHFAFSAGARARWVKLVDNAFSDDDLN